MREKKAKKLLEQVKTTYNQIAEEFSDSRVYYWEDFKFFAPYLKPDSEIVDLGCGNGRLIKFLAQQTMDWNKPAFHYIGIDNSKALLKKAQALYPQEVFILGDQLQIPIGENIVDLIFNIRAFHHIPSKQLQLKALDEINRILKKDGILILTVWNLWQKKYWHRVINGILRSIMTLGAYHPNDLFIPWGKEKIPRYYHAFLPRELEKLMRKAGFEIMELFYIKDGQKVHFKESHDICLIAKKITTLCVK